MIIKAFVEVREGRKLLGSNTAPIEVIQSLMLDAMSNDAAKVMIAWAPIREGNSVHFKHKGKNVTVKPLVNHIDQY